MARPNLTLCVSTLMMRKFSVAFASSLDATAEVPFFFSKVSGHLVIEGVDPSVSILPLCASLFGGSAVISSGVTSPDV